MTTTEPEAPEAKKTTATVTVDGVTFEAQPGELLIKAAQDNGIYIPRFCWHERMKPVGMCRMCLVEIEGGRGYPPACTTPVTDGMVVHSQNDAVKQIQDGVLEFLLVNHPLDCPVCDRGGECPLQDQTLAFGPGESRFVEEKRHFPKPIPLSELVLLDRERCIQCARCIRFADEIAGDPLIDFIDRGDRMQVLNFEEQPFDSYFSGNTVQICPVGALTASQYRFRARPWDLATVETSCTTCSVHCRGAVQSSSNRLVRLLGVDSEPVNHGWLCDKGRYGLEWVHSDRRLLEPAGSRGRHAAARSRGPTRSTARPTRSTRPRSSTAPRSIAVLGGARGTNEDAYLWSMLAKGVIGTDNVDAQLGDGLPADFVLGMARAEIADLDRASAIVVLDHDLRDQVPVLFLRLRRRCSSSACRSSTSRPSRMGSSRMRAAVVRASCPASRSQPTTHDEITRVCAGRSGPVVVIVGRGNLAASAAVRRRQRGRARPRARRALPLGVAARERARRARRRPRPRLPARAHDARRGPRLVHATVGRVFPPSAGSTPTASCAAAADGKIRVLVLLGADPISDFPDATLVRRARRRGRHDHHRRRLRVGVDEAGRRVPALHAVGREGGNGHQPRGPGAAGRAARSRPRAPRWTTGGSRRSSRCASGAISTSTTVDEVTDEIARVAPACDGRDRPS